MDLRRDVELCLYLAARRISTPRGLLSKTSGEHTTTPAALGISLVLIRSFHKRRIARFPSLRGNWLGKSSLGVCCLPVRCTRMRACVCMLPCRRHSSFWTSWHKAMILRDILDSMARVHLHTAVICYFPTVRHTRFTRYKYLHLFAPRRAATHALSQLERSVRYGEIFGSYGVWVCRVCRVPLTSVRTVCC